jgi:replicative DNA helicase
VSLEARLLGALLQVRQHDNPDQARQWLDALGLRPDDFLAHRQIFSAIHALLGEAKAATPDAVARLLGQPDLEWSLKEWRSQALPSLGALRGMAEDVKNASRLRVLQRLAGELDAATRQPQAKAAALLDHVETQLRAMSARTAPDITGEQLAYSLAERLDEVDRGGEPRLPTGIAELDRLIHGGLLPTLTLLGGAPGRGKSAVAATLVRNVMQQQKRVGLLALEDGAEDGYLTRWVADHAGLPWGAVGGRKLLGEEAARTHDALAEYAADGRFLRTTRTTHGLTGSQVVEVARDWVLNHDVKLVVVDHLGELLPEEEKQAWSNKSASIQRTLQELRRIAVEYRTPVLVLAHFTRDAGRERRAPALHDFAESEWVGRMSRLALGLWHFAEPGEVWVSVLKYTRGPLMANRRKPAAVLQLKQSALVGNVGGSLVDEEMLLEREEHLQ